MDDTPASPEKTPNAAAPASADRSWWPSIGLGMLAGGGVVLLIGALLIMFSR